MKHGQLSIEQLSNGYTKGSGMKENNDSSKSTTLTLLHSWAKQKGKAKQGHHRHNKREGHKRHKRDTTRHKTTNRHETDKRENTCNTKGFKTARYP